ncbi:hypothetical protein BDV98DRAFT_602015 [Pterulicium gracile]|uniref:Transmembrane protein n=1 Tax=Pterulicium gracile TaxID=1884261 RepID=A0A5C3QRI8_9AGAR|nr:hypothetical protein BDV98DRAFT_602015 [Pterula gracilis]
MALATSFHIEDSTPQIRYSPPPAHDHSPDPTARWTPYFDVSGFSSVHGEPGHGTGYHMTSREGASLSFEFHGTGVQLLGTSIRANYSVILDDSPLPVDQDAQNVLAQVTGLPYQQHLVTLILHKGSSISSVSFDKAVITSDFVPEHNSRRPPPPPHEVQRVEFVGDWAQRNVPSLEETSVYHCSHTAGDRTIVAFAGSSFFLTGASSPSAGAFSVTLDKNITTTLSATSSFLNPDTLLYYVGGLDAAVPHELEILNVNGSEMYIKSDGFSSAPSVTRTHWLARQLSNDTSAEAPPDTGYPGGTIAALVLAGILIFIIVTSSLFYFMVHRPRQRRRAQDRRTFVNEPKSGVFEQPTLFRDSSSRRRGFDKWRHDVEVGLGLGTLASFGLSFRQSSEDGPHSRRSTASTTDDDEYADDVPLSSKSETTSTRSSERARRKMAKGKMKAFTGSWRNSKSASRHNGRTRSLSSPPNPYGSELSHNGDGTESVYFAPIYKGKVVEATTYPTHFVPATTASSVISHPFSGQARPPQPLDIPTVNIQSPTEDGSPLFSNRSPPRRSPATVHGASPLTSAALNPREGSGDDGSVIEADSLGGEMNVSTTTQVALRGLSPRTSEVMPRNFHVIPPLGPRSSPSRHSDSKDLPRLPSPAPSSSQHSSPIDKPIFNLRSAHSSSEVLYLGEMSRKKTPSPRQDSTEERRSGSKEKDATNGGGSRRTSTGLSVRFSAQVDEQKAEKGKGKDPSETTRPDRERTGVLKPFAKRRHLDQPPSSFLDLDSSSSGGSTRSPSNGSSLGNPQRGREQSRWSNTTASYSLSGHPLQSQWSSTIVSSSPSVVDDSQTNSHRMQDVPLPDSGVVLDLSPQSSNSTGNPFPYPISLPPSPHHPEHILQMQQAQAALGLHAHADSELGNSTYLNPGGVPTSPTDSLPTTVSEIQFRHNSFSEEGYGAHPPPHPRLPPLFSEESTGSRPTPIQTAQVPFIVQRVLGGQSSAGPNSPITPLAGTPRIPPSRT